MACSQEVQPTPTHIDHSSRRGVSAAIKKAGKDLDDKATDEKASTNPHHSSHDPDQNRHRMSQRLSVAVWKVCQRTYTIGVSAGKEVAHTQDATSTKFSCRLLDRLIAPSDAAWIGLRDRLRNSRLQRRDLPCPKVAPASAGDSLLRNPGRAHRRITPDNRCHPAMP